MKPLTEILVNDEEYKPFFYRRKETDDEFDKVFLQYDNCNMVISCYDMTGCVAEELPERTPENDHIVYDFALCELGEEYFMVKKYYSELTGEFSIGGYENVTAMVKHVIDKYSSYKMVVELFNEIAFRWSEAERQNIEVSSHLIFAGMVF